MGPRSVNGNKNYVDYVVNVYCQNLQVNGTKTCRSVERCLSDIYRNSVFEDEQFN